MGRAEGIQLLGPALDSQSRCVHYHAHADVVAIRFYCCMGWYPCIRCHEECADHVVQVWPKSQRTEQALWCGQCRTTLSIAEYLQAAQCPACQKRFNPGCASHHHRYFEL